MHAFWEESIDVEAEQSREGLQVIWDFSDVTAQNSKQATHLLFGQIPRSSEYDNASIGGEFCGLSWQTKISYHFMPSLRCRERKAKTRLTIAARRDRRSCHNDVDKIVVGERAETWLTSYKWRCRWLIGPSSWREGMRLINTMQYSGFSWGSLSNPQTPLICDRYSCLWILLSTTAPDWRDRGAIAIVHVSNTNFEGKMSAFGHRTYSILGLPKRWRNYQKKNKERCSNKDYLEESCSFNVIVFVESKAFSNRKRPIYFCKKGLTVVDTGRKNK